MKKLFLMLTACCLIFASCNNPKNEEATQENEQQTEQTCEKKDCCKDKHECCKKMMEDWNNFDNLTAEEQANLIEKKGGFITEILSKVNLDEIECPNAKQAVKEFQTKWEGFAKADQKTKKALIDEFDNAHWKHAVMPEKCCKGEKEGCCDKEKEGCCKDKEGCCDKGKKEGCCDKK